MCWEDGEKKVTRAMAEPDMNDPCLYLEFIDSTPTRTALPKSERDHSGLPDFPLSCIARSRWAPASASPYFTTTVGNQDYSVTNFVVSPRLVFKPLRAFGRSGGTTHARDFCRCTSGRW